MLDALLGKPKAVGRDYILQQDNNGQSLGLRQGDWKLVRKGGRKSSANDELYDLSKDPGEKNNLALQNPETLEKLRGLLRQILEAPGTRPGFLPASSPN